jgi:hypothetical protein
VGTQKVVPMNIGKSRHSRHFLFMGSGYAEGLQRPMSVHKI